MYTILLLLYLSWPHSVEPFSRKESVFSTLGSSISAGTLNFVTLSGSQVDWTWYSTAAIIKNYITMKKVSSRSKNFDSTQTWGAIRPCMLPLLQTTKWHFTWVELAACWILSPDLIYNYHISVINYHEQKRWWGLQLSLEPGLEIQNAVVVMSQFF